MEAQGGQGVRMGDIAKTAGISRQAVYLHYNSRTELMVATTRYIDEVRGLDKCLQAYRAATGGVEILTEFIKFWGNYIPEIYGLAKALLAVRETDEDAAAAWTDRMNAVRSGCRRSIEALDREGKLDPAFSTEQAIDLLMTILSVHNWEHLTIERKWTIEQYVKAMEILAKKTLLK